MVRVKMQNPAGPAALLVVNPKRRSKSMPARKRVTRRRRRTTAVHHRANPVRRTRRASTHRVRRVHTVARRRSVRRRNPLFAHHKRRRVTRRRNPAGVFSEAVPLVGASFVITFAAPMVTRLVGGFLPLGQFTQPVVLAGTGYGLGWIAKKLKFDKYQKPLEIMGVTLGLTALVAPYLRGLFAPSAPAQAQGMNGFRGGSPGRRGLNGIAAITGIPPMITAPPMPTHAGQGMQGVGLTNGRFGR